MEYTERNSAASGMFSAVLFIFLANARIRSTQAEWVWVLDPIDGTKSFITGKPLFGTLIACLHHGTPVVGVIDQCVLQERWVGVKGEETKLNGETVHAQGCNTLKKAMMYATTPHMFAPGKQLFV